VDIGSEKRKETSAQRKEVQVTVLQLVRELQSRIYNAEVFIWNLRDNARNETALKSWENYKTITIKWNESLPSNYIVLDILFPKNRCLISKCPDNCLNGKSFRDVLENDIQKEFIWIHGRLVSFKKNVLQNEEVDRSRLKEVESRAEKLHSKILTFSESLAVAMNQAE